MNDLRAKGSPKRGEAGELLTSHLLNTLRALRSIRSRIGAIPGVPAEFWTWAALAALLHDTGKIPAGFQRMIGNTDEPSTPWGERHEVLSLGFVELLLARLPAEGRLWVASAVAAHHRPFTCGPEPSAKTPIFNLYGADEPTHFHARFTPADQAALSDLLMWLHETARRSDLPCDDRSDTSVEGLVAAAHRLFQDLHDRWNKMLRPNDPDGRTAVLLQGVVTMADHLSSAQASLHSRHPLTPDYPTELAQRLAADGHALRPQQTNAAETNGHLLLRSWTGSGKTEGALLWATRQIAELSRTTGGTPRLFYLLPYLASINAMVKRLGKELRAPDDIGVAHAHAASFHLDRSLADECSDEGLVADADRSVKAAAKARSRAKATKNFRELLRVGTPYQLLRGALAGPVHSSVLADSANSVLVLDELHAYDAHRLGMILAMMRFWAELGGRVAVMSATFPTTLKTLVRNALKGTGPVAEVEPPTGTPPPARHRLSTREAHLTDPASLHEIETQLAAGRSVLVVANNVRDAIDLYEPLARRCADLHGPGSAFLLHSRFRRMDRDTIERGIQGRFGKDAERRLPGLLVGTQAVEVSLDLDFDLCHTSAADLEALLQRFGRVNRYAHRPPAPVVVHQPTYTKRRGSADTLWADGIYPAEPTEYAWKKLTQHDGHIVDERTATTWLDEIYEKTDWGQQWRKDVEGHRERFDRGFLTFRQPFDDRSSLAEEFDAMFEGTEAVLLQDLEAYKEALDTGDDKGASRLLSEQYLVPLPHWGGRLTQWEKNLRVRVIDGDYDETLGLQAVRNAPASAYQRGAVL
ncbi:CRISPR-associated helicase Cas3' [Streptomyces sp. B6B3]|uniref:CRISPR-associated helicase Cas3' n=1 Tax=Streptomyces sp. B6B3 TaxID=3153570 RepID=UPI00325F717D